MLKVIIISILIVLSIFFGFYPLSSSSPLNKLMKYLGINSKVSTTHHIILGVILYIIAIIIAHVN